MHRLVLFLLIIIYLTSLNCSNIESKNLRRYEGFLYKTVAISTDHYQNHTIYIKGFDPNVREDIVCLAKLLVCYSKSGYIMESLKYFDFEANKILSDRNLPIGRIFIVSKWSDNFHYIKPKKRIASINAALADKIELKIYDNSFPHAKVIYSLSDLGIDYYSQVCN